MNKNIDKKIEDILSGIDKNKLMQSKKSVEEFLKTSEGQKLKSQLKEVDKNKLLNMLTKMNTDEIRKKLNKTDLSHIDPNDIINKLK